MHFSNFFRWMEETEHAFYRSLGLAIHPLEHGHPQAQTGWPRLKASAEYRAPLQFAEEVNVELLVAEVRTRAIRYAFRFWKSPDASQEQRVLAATGELVVVAVQASPETGRMTSTLIPDDFRAGIQPAPEELLRHL